MKNKTLSKNIATIIIIILFIICVSLVFSSIKAHRENRLMYVFGVSYSVVPTASMEPTIMTNDIILIKKSKFEDVKVDDIIVYYNQKEGIFIVHRVTGFFDDGSLITKGDNNTVGDSSPYLDDSLQGVGSDLFLGKVFFITHALGIGSIFVSSRSLLVLMVVFLFLGIFIYEIVKIIISAKHKKIETEKKEKEDEEIAIMREQLRQEVLRELKEEQKKEE